MAQEVKKEKPIGNANAEMFNYEQRVKTELEAPHKWNEAWGDFFKLPGSVPQEYGERIEYLETELSKFPKNAVVPPRYGTAFNFKDDIGKDYRRRLPANLALLDDIYS